MPVMTVAIRGDWASGRGAIPPIPPHAGSTATYPSAVRHTREAVAVFSAPCLTLLPRPGNEVVFCYVTVVHLHVATSDFIGILRHV